MTYYDQIALGYNQLYSQEQLTKLQTALDKSPFFLSGSVLDVGCGTGISSDFWFDMCKCDVTGIDPSEGLLAQYKSNKSTLLQGFAEKLPFTDNQFDVVVSFSAIQNFDDILTGLQEIRRVGKGKFILSVMSRGKNADEIDQQIRSLFIIEESVVCLNDTIYFCTND